MSRRTALFSAAATALLPFFPVRNAAALVPPEPTEHVDTLLFASVRKYIPADGGGSFTADRGSALAVGTVTFARGQPGALRKALSLGPGDFVPGSPRLSTGDQNAEGFVRETDGREVMLYVHGYRETFVSAATTTFDLARAIGFDQCAAFFSWPSTGGTLDYARDRESALWSREHLADLLTALLRRGSREKVHLVAHSMGTLLVLESLREVLREGGGARMARLGAVVLAAPDVDMDLFVQAVERLKPLAERITVISAVNDRALALSSVISGGERAGMVDRERLERLGVRVADASEFAAGILNHDLYLSNPDVVQVVRRAMDRAGE
ncbi:MAG: alpha/beta fold hydrolase [Methylobacteriaceae bacterium]|jgi:esterase/lipase superfamily enzyme|nr:alpha/beta fold hydrolase [Methylobacteriaceae bacterium]